MTSWYCVTFDGKGDFCEARGEGHLGFGISWLLIKEDVIGWLLRFFFLHFVVTPRAMVVLSIGRLLRDIYE